MADSKVASVKLGVAVIEKTAVLLFCGRCK